MSENYGREVLRVAVAQICQTIGYNGTQTTPLELLQDILHKFLHEFARDLRHQVEHYNRSEVNLSDTCLTLKSLNINISELVDYISNVEAVPCSVEVPKFPLPKDSHLNFLKPGSKEVLTRPVHIFEYLPPILPAEPCSLDAVAAASTSAPMSALNADETGDPAALFGFGDSISHRGSIKLDSTVIDNKFSNAVVPKNTADSAVAAKSDGVYAPEIIKSAAQTTAETFASYLKAKSTGSTASPLNVNHLLDEEGRPTREISSVVMTTGGFISPAIEGKLPDTLIPDIIDKLQGLDAPPPSAPQSPAVSAVPPISAIIRNTIVDAKIENETSVSATNAASSATTTAAKLSQKSYASANKGRKSADISTVAVTSAGIESASFGASQQAQGSGMAKRLCYDKAAATGSISGLPITSAALATKLLKKAKKKSSTNMQAYANLPTRVTGKFGCAEAANATGTSDNVMDMVTALNPGRMDKEMRKRCKMMEKMCKSKPLGNEMDRVELFYAMGMNFYNDKFDRRKRGELGNKRSGKKNEAKSVSAERKKSDALGADTIANSNPKGADLTGAAATAASAGSHTQTPAMQVPKVDGFMLVQPLTSKVATAATTTNRDGATAANLNPIDKHTALVEDQEDNHSNIDNAGRPPYEIKLSNEPDRSKLNIFKKISKQKGANTGKAPSPSQNLSIGTVYGSSHNTVINLPSGTTITPAPPVLGAATTMLSTQDQLREADMLLTHADNAMLADSADLTKKPKKRGRKPGSKNQAKLSPGNIVQSGVFSPTAKKSKKLKMDKQNLCPIDLAFPDTPMEQGGGGKTGTDTLSNTIAQHMASNNNSEPLNLTHTAPKVVFGANSAAFAPVHINSLIDHRQKLFPYPAASMPPKSKETRKERRKLKLNKAGSLSKSGASGDANFPTREEVNYINKKLLRMDTVLKPAPKSSASALHLGRPDFMSTVASTLKSADIVAATNATAAGKSSSTKKRQQQYTDVMSSTPAMAAHFAEMYPLFPLLPRPGLIPTPGLFPTPADLSKMSNSSSKTSAVATTSSMNMLPLSFLSVANLKSTVPTGFQDVDAVEHDKTALKSAPSLLLPPPPAKGERSSYCNVAPLVPESMKLLSPIEAKQQHAQLYREDFPKTPKLNKASSAASWKGYEATGAVVGGTLSTPEGLQSGVDNNNKSLPPTPGGISLKSYEALTMRPNNNVKSGSTMSAFQMAERSLFNTTELIELSDDSMDALPTTTAFIPAIAADLYGQSQALATATATNAAAKLNQSGNNKTGNMCSVDAYMDDIFKSNNISNSGKMMTINDTLSIISPDSNSSSKDLKTLKKPSKLNKQQQKLQQQPQQLFSNPFKAGGGAAPRLDMLQRDCGAGGGVAGKLAGGADLIPLRGTGLAYSAKTIPANSLTAGTANTAALGIACSVPNSSQVSSNAYAGPALVSTPVNRHMSDNLSTPANNNAGISTAPGAAFSDILLATASTMLSQAAATSTSQKQKRKEHKKLKKLKEGKIKKKKDKKDKSKSKELRQENQQLHTAKIDAGKLWRDKDLDKYQQLAQTHHHLHHKNKELTRKLKKEKKKEKQRYAIDLFDATAGVQPTCSVSAAATYSNSNRFEEDASAEKLHISTARIAAPATLTAAGAENSNNTALVPKLTLKLSSGAGSSSQSPPGFDADKINSMLMSPTTTTTCSSTSTSGQSTSTTASTPNSLATPREKRDPSPELARISPLVTRPPKQKLSVIHEANLTAATSGCSNADSYTEVNTRTPASVNVTSGSASSSTTTTAATTHGLIQPPPTPWPTGGTLTASSVLLPQQLSLLATSSNKSNEQPLAYATHTSTPGDNLVTAATLIGSGGGGGGVGSSSSTTGTFTTLISESNRPSSYIDADGNRVWICPACGKVDDGSPMIGCDGCDAWYHWVCVGIFVAPKDNEDWFCRVCITRKKGLHTTDKKRKRNKKK